MDGKYIYKYVDKIVSRAESLGFTSGNRICHILDIEYANEVFDIDLKSWLESDDINFMHDYVGIYTNIDREKVSTMANTECFNHFVPRFAKN